MVDVVRTQDLDALGREAVGIEDAFPRPDGLRLTPAKGARRGHGKWHAKICANTGVQQLPCDLAAIDGNRVAGNRALDDLRLDLYAAGKRHQEDASGRLQSAQTHRPDRLQV